MSSSAGSVCKGFGRRYRQNLLRSFRPTTERGRDLQLDAMKGVTIILVVLGHTLMHARSRSRIIHLAGDHFLPRIMTGPLSTGNLVGRVLAGLTITAVTIVFSLVVSIFFLRQNRVLEFLFLGKTDGRKAQPDGGAPQTDEDRRREPGGEPPIERGVVEYRIPPAGV